MGTPDHHFSPDLARECGVDAAIFLHNIYHWVKYNKAYKKNFYEGRYWTFNSISAFCEAHPYWSKRQIERIVATCKSAGMLLTGCFNKDKRDRTVWYTLSEKAYTYFSDVPPKADECSSPNGEMEDTEQGNTCPETVGPLPYNSPDNSLQAPYSPPAEDVPPKSKRKRRPKSVPEWQPEKFEGFWAAYPRDECRAKAVEQWDALPRDKELMNKHLGDEDALLREIALGLKRHLASPDWQKKFGIPYAFRWLRDRRWMEKAKRLPDSAPGSDVSEPPRERHYHTELVNGEEVVVYDD